MVAFLIGIYGFIFTTVTDPLVRYTLIFFPALALVLSGPLYVFLRYKKRLPWKTILVRILLTVIIVITGAPIITVGGFFYGVPGILYGFSLIPEGQLLHGILLILVWVFALFGLVTFWSLAKHFWNKPLDNPTGAQLKRNIIGLAMGLCAVPGFWVSSAIFGSDIFGTYVAFLALFTIPLALFFMLLLGLNSLRTRNNASGIIS